MPIERSAGVIIFRNEGKKRYYLLLHYPKGSRSSFDYWEFPKGHVEAKEKLLATAQREAKEETGLENLEFLKGFKTTIRYFFQLEGKKILKFVTFFLAKTNQKEVKISEEHLGYGWFTFQDALNKIRFKNSKEVLEKAEEFLNANF